MPHILVLAIAACTATGDLKITETTAGTPRDVTAPFVHSITRLGAAIDAGVSASFAVEFSEPVSGVSPSAFTLVTTSLTGATVASVTGSGAHYILVVSSGVGDGTVRVDFTDGTMVKDAASLRAIVPFVSGDTVVFQKSNPNSTTIASAISPGGNIITIVGPGFYPGTTVRLGGASAVSCPTTVLSSTSMTCVVPLNPNGPSDIRTVDLYILNPSGSSVTVINGFTYLGSPALWLDADDGAQVTSVAGQVSQWSDKSTNVNHSFQSTAGSRPSRAVNAHGRTVIQFAWSQYLLVNDSASIRPTTSLALLASLRVNAGTSSYAGFFTYPYYTNQS